MSMDARARTAGGGRWRDAIAPYVERGPIGALMLGLSSGAPFALIAATLTTRLAEAGVDKKLVTAFALTFLFYNVKFLWAPLIDRGRLPILGPLLGQRRSWLCICALGVAGSLIWLGYADPSGNLSAVVAAALSTAFFGASLDIVVDAYRIESLSRKQLGAGSGMSQYGWRLGAAGAGALALVVANRWGWTAAYAAGAVFMLPALLAALLLGEPRGHAVELAAEPATRGWKAVRVAVVAPLADFLGRPGALLVLGFILIHKLGDTLANLSLRLLFADLGFDKDVIAAWDVGLGLAATLFGVLAGGIVFNRLGMMRSVMLSLVLMAVSNLGFAWLATVGSSAPALGAAVGFENFASGVGGVAVVAYLSWLCNLRFTATQFALLSALASVVGRLMSGATAGVLIEKLGFLDFYLLTTVLALPGIFLFALLMQRGSPDVRAGPRD